MSAPRRFLNDLGYGLFVILGTVTGLAALVAVGAAMGGGFYWLMTVA